MKSWAELPALIAIASIGVYQSQISPLLANRVTCRFHPTCSEYASLSIQTYGLRVGSVKAWHRYARCTPTNVDSCIDLP